ncbi:MAG: hypothetical protein Q7J31_04570 [Syntrophales bacterium]|nr:hypothetical protein [Syntrophales bacterium]
MDQIVFIIGGAFITLIYYIFSPISLSARLLGLLEQFGKSDAIHPVGKPAKARNYYVHHLK